MSEMAARICASCGARNALDASFCGRCGRILPENLEREGSQDVATFDEAAQRPHAEAGQRQDAPLFSAAGDKGAEYPGSDNLEDTLAALQAPREAVMQKRCAWCSGVSSWTAATCEICGARFPIPEQDAAFQRAAEERMRQDMESLEFWRQRRQRRGWRRFLI